MVATECYQLFTNRASSIGLPLALLGVTDYPLHLMTGGKSTVSISTLASMDQALDTSLYAQLPGLLWVACRRHLTTTSIKIKPKLLHLVRMTILLIASHAQVEVLADSAVVSCLH